MATKQKPNERCDCGSGKKFKKCCKIKGRTIEEQRTFCKGCETYHSNVDICDRGEDLGVLCWTCFLKTPEGEVALKARHLSLVKAREDLKTRLNFLRAVAYLGAQRK